LFCNNALIDVSSFETCFSMLNMLARSGVKDFAIFL
jgi:hypothetical protein